ncbi:helix-turn-helix domain-containing protein [Pedobacter cryoconitis]|nr:helix-turn-helix domain-containing protein [Pedobacter cryoconitis]
MKFQHHVAGYSIKDIIDYRALSWPESEEFLFLTQIPVKFEPFLITPTYYCFGMITKGKLEIEIDEEPYQLCANSLMVYRPGQVFKVTDLEEQTRGVFILFTKKFLDNLNENIFSVQRSSFLSAGIKSVFELSGKDKAKTLNTFHKIFTLLQYLSKTNWELIARNLTSALIYETDSILKKYIDPSTVLLNKNEDLFQRFKSLVTIHAIEKRALSFYAAKLLVSTHHLYTTVKLASQKTPTEIINTSLINTAKNKVLYTHQTLAEIAEQLNFSDAFSFSKFFKKHTGYAPTLYKKASISWPD